MAVPAFRTVGATVQGVNNATASQNLSPVAPVGRVVGDLLLCITTTSHNTGACATPSGWTLTTGFPITSGTAVGGRIYVFKRTADGTSADNATCAWTSLTTSTSGSSIAARISAWANATTTQAGTVGTATDAAVTTPINIPTITTTGTHRLVVGIALKISGTVQTGTVTNYTERQDFDLVANATDHQTYTAELIQAAAGATAVGAITPSSTTSSRCLAISVAFVSDLTALVALGSSPAVSNATLALTAPAVVPLETAAAVSSATFALTAETQVPLETAAATSSATLDLTAPSTTFSPTDIAGLECWLKADAIGGADGDPVTTWQDSHTSNQDATGASGQTLQTNEINGLGVVRFDGVDDKMAITGITNNDATRTIFCLQRNISIATTDAVYGFSNVAALRSMRTDPSWNTNEAAATQGIGTAPVLGTAFHTTMRFNSTSSADAWVGGTQAANFNPSDNYQGGAVVLTIGARTGGGEANVEIAELLIYDTALSDTDVGLVQGYLNDRYGLGAAPAVIPLETAAATSSATLALAAPATVPLGTAAATSSATLALTAKPTVALQTAAATSSATLALTAKPTVVLGTAAAVSSATLTLTAPARVVLGTAVSVSSATLALRAQTYVPLGTAAAISTATLSVTAGPGVIAVQASNAVSTAMLALTARTQVVLATAAAQSSATLAVTTPSIPVIALESAAASSSATLLLFAGVIFVTHPPTGGEVTELIRGGVFDETVSGGVVAEHVRGGIVVASSRGGVVTEDHRGAIPVETLGGVFDETAAGGAVVTPTRGGAVTEYVRGGVLVGPNGGVVVEQQRGGSVTQPTRGGVLTEPKRGGVFDETSTGGSIA